MIVFYELEDRVGDGSQVGRLPGADSAHPGPGPGTLRHRRYGRLHRSVDDWTVDKPMLENLKLSWTREIQTFLLKLISINCNRVK